MPFILHSAFRALFVPCKGPHLIDGFQRALGFLTVCPVRASDNWTPETLGQSMVYYPLVGALIGFVLWLLFALLSLFFATSVVNVLILAGLVLLTGGLHLDGWSDTIDGLNGGYSRERILEIFKDSHVGAMAVIGVVLIVLLKYACLNEVSADRMLSTLVLMGTLSRYGMVQLASFSVYARASGGLGQPFVQGIRRSHFGYALLLTIVLVVAVGGWRGALMAGCVGLATLAYRLYFHRRLGGITGDILGASNEMSEALVLLLVTIIY